MSYMALYRKFRPQDFSEVKGQDHIVTTLRNEIEADRIGHAYLFTGTRGTGKTTVAKIFARAVNCEHPLPDGSPCGECETCRAIASGSSMNVIEIDAASNNGVENIRNIIEDVEYPPAAGKYKVYIIDEVHMLSAGAFNAFLKTLEEPPSYVIFILATTELQKIPVTILSRCQRYDFHRISVETISSRLRELVDREGVKASDEALAYVAKAGDGSMRDALSLLDQCINFYLGQDLDYDKVLSVLGAVDTEVLSELYNAVLDKDINHICEIIDDVMTQGRDLNTFVSDFIWYLRDMLLYRNAPGMAESFDMTSENRKVLQENAEKAGTEVLMRYIRILSDLTNRMRLVTDRRVVLEVALIRLCMPEMDTDNEALINRIENVEREIKKGVRISVNASQQAPTQASAQQVKKKPLPDAVAEEVQKAAGVIDEVINSLGNDLVYLPAVWKHCRPTSQVTAEGDGNALVIYFDDESSFEQMDRDRQAINDALDQKIGAHVDLIMKKNDTGVPSKDQFSDLSRVDFKATLGIDIPEE